MSDATKFKITPEFRELFEEALIEAVKYDDESAAFHVSRIYERKGEEVRARANTKHSYSSSSDDLEVSLTVRFNYWGEKVPEMLKYASDEQEAQDGAAIEAERARLVAEHERELAAFNAKQKQLDERLAALDNN